MISPEALQFQRNVALLGIEGTARLLESRVLVAGIGGVGGFACEALARAGVGSIVFIDSDEVDETNINRQIIATHATVGMPKVEVMAQRLGTINPEGAFTGVQTHISEDNLDDLIEEYGPFDMIVDAVDDVGAKIALAVTATGKGIPIISSMGCANKTDPTRFQVADIYETSVCPLAQKMRKELKNRSIPALRVVYSTETPVKTGMLGSLSFVPSVCGLIIAGDVIKRLSGLSEREVTEVR